MLQQEDESLALLARQHGLGDAYHDFRGVYRPFTPAARSAILLAMGVDLHGRFPAPPSSQIASLLPVVRVCTRSERFCDLTLDDALLQRVATSPIAVVIQTEQGEEHRFSLGLPELPRNADGTCRLPLPALETGYHHLIVSVPGLEAHCPLIVTPDQCYQPPAMQQRRWGLSVQLYTLRSASNWGIGDFDDLHQLIRQSAPLGCDTIGLNPLHALRPADAAHISPYSPSHREFLNVLYIAVPKVPEYQYSTAVRELVNNAQAMLQTLRIGEVVDYLGVARFKFQVLRLLFGEFARNELTHDTPRAQHFRQYVAQQGEALYLHALYDALDQYFSTQIGHHWGWRSWPAHYHDPNSAAVKEFAVTHQRQIEYFMYLQWLAMTQLQEAQQLAKDCGMSLGLYGDVAVGVDPNGSEVWSNRRLYVEGVAVGAPPDPLALKGQNWGIPPQHPQQLREQGYQPFIRMLRANMRAAGALRIDHVMTLCRLWWVPNGFEATEGVYVYYPLDDLMKLVALESERNQCLVIGEDLGTVPDAMRHAMERFALYHYKVLFFEKAHDGQFIAPHDYPAHALAVVTTHDLPPFRSWWQGDDIRLRQQLELYPDDATREQVVHEREHDKHLLMQALVRAGLWHWQPHEAVPGYSPALMRAAYLLAGLSNAKLLVIQPEDLQHMIDPVNVPGTSTEHANWQRKLSEDLMLTLGKPEIQEVLLAMGKARKGESPNGWGAACSG